MLPLRSSFNETLFTEPLPFLRYETSPEVISSWHFSDAGETPLPWVNKVYGKPAAEANLFQKLKSLRETSPANYAHLIRDVTVYNGALLGANGVYPDSARIRPQENHGPGSRNRWVFFPGTKNKLGTAHYCNNYMVAGDHRKPISTFEEPCMIFYGYNNTGMPYGHALLEELPRLWVFLENGIIDRDIKLLIRSHSGQVPSFLLEFVRPFGLTINNFHICDDVELRKSMYIVSRPVMLYHYINKRAQVVWDKVRDFYAPTDGGVNSPRKLYISRTNCRPTRKLVNEEECIDLFIKYGFTIIRPEEYPVQKQIQLFADATHVAGPMGSGLHNIVFSRNPETRRLFIMTPEKTVFLSNYLMIEMFFRGHSDVCFGQALPPAQQSKPNLSHSQRKWRMDIENLKIALDQWMNSKS